jgi:hypothetical protein
MSCGDMVRGPFGLDAMKGQTVPYQRTVLVIVHTVTAGTRLGDVVPLLESDRRVQVVYTCVPSALIRNGTERFLERLGGVVIPWQQAAQARFDLAVAASAGLLEWVHAPVLTMPHGTGFSKYPARWDGYGPETQRTAAGPEPARLICHGRVIASASIVATQRQLERLRRSCPDAAAVAVVAGDPCFDRLAASLPARGEYRTALDAGDRTLIAVSSTWGPGSLLSRRPGLLRALIDELPADRYRIAAIVHPGVWSWHGARQVCGWYADCLQRGLVLVPPEEGWRGVLAAADVVIGDHGSVTCYAAAAGIPVLLASFPGDEVEPGSPVARLGEIAPRLRPGEPCAPQIRQAASRWPARMHTAVREQVTDLPGQSARIIRSVMYRLMNLPEPPDSPCAGPVPVPEPVHIPQTFGGSR